MASSQYSFAKFHNAPSLQRNGDAALEAFYDGDLQKLREILSQNAEYLDGTAGKVPIPFCQLAARENRTDVLQLLIDLGGGMQHLQHPDGAGKNCLHTAIRHKAFDAVNLLLQNGFDPNEMDTEGQTPLHAACIIEDSRFVATLLEAEADCNVADQSGNLPIHQACQEDQIKMVRLLLPKTLDIIIAQ